MGDLRIGIDSINTGTETNNTVDNSKTSGAWDLTTMRDTINSFKASELIKENDTINEIDTNGWDTDEDEDSIFVDSKTENSLVGDIEDTEEDIFNTVDTESTDVFVDTESTDVFVDTEEVEDNTNTEYTRLEFFRYKLIKDIDTVLKRHNRSIEDYRSLEDDILSCVEDISNIDFTKQLMLLDYKLYIIDRVYNSYDFINSDVSTFDIESNDNISVLIEEQDKSDLEDNEEPEEPEIEDWEDEEPEEPEIEDWEDEEPEEPEIEDWEDEETEEPEIEDWEDDEEPEEPEIEDWEDEEPEEPEIEDWEDDEETEDFWKTQDEIEEEQELFEDESWEEDEDIFEESTGDKELAEYANSISSGLFDSSWDEEETEEDEDSSWDEEETEEDEDTSWAEEKTEEDEDTSWDDEEETEEEDSSWDDEEETDSNGFIADDDDSWDDDDEDENVQDTLVDDNDTSWDDDDDDTDIDYDNNENSISFDDESWDIDDGDFLDSKTKEENLASWEDDDEEEYSLYSKPKTTNTEKDYSKEFENTDGIIRPKVVFDITKDRGRKAQHTLDSIAVGLDTLGSLGKLLNKSYNEGED